jgi:hypothetical protein
MSTTPAEGIAHPATSFVLDSLVLTLTLSIQMLFFGSKCERLCMMQFALVSLIPGLIANLQDAADPSLDSYAENIQRSTSLRNTDRASRKSPAL